MKALFKKAAIDSETLATGAGLGAVAGAGLGFAASQFRKPGETDEEHESRKKKYTAIAGLAGGVIGGVKGRNADRNMTKKYLDKIWNPSKTKQITSTAKKFLAS